MLLVYYYYHYYYYCYYYYYYYYYLNRFARSPYPRVIPGELCPVTEGVDRYHPGPCGNPGYKAPKMYRTRLPKCVRKCVFTKYCKLQYMARGGCAQVL